MRVSLRSNNKNSQINSAQLKWQYDPITKHNYVNMDQIHSCQVILKSRDKYPPVINSVIYPLIVDSQNIGYYHGSQKIFLKNQWKNLPKNHQFFLDSFMKLRSFKMCLTFNYVHATHSSQCHNACPFRCKMAMHVVLGAWFDQWWSVGLVQTIKF
jgi:hypothetical protein